jgi:phage baseplate assembly protein W
MLLQDTIGIYPKAFSNELCGTLMKMYDTALITGNTFGGTTGIGVDKTIKNSVDFDLIKQDLINHFYIRQGERLMQPNFGTIIWSLLFEPLTEQLKDLILQNVNEILNYDPRVQATNVLVTPYDTGLQIEATLKYIPYNIQQNLQLKFDQANGLITA